MKTTDAYFYKCDIRPHIVDGSWTPHQHPHPIPQCPTPSSDTPFCKGTQNLLEHPVNTISPSSKMFRIS